MDYEMEQTYGNSYGIEDVSADDLMECICTLPDTYRTVFNLYAVEGYSHREIAAMLNIAESTSRSSFYRARQLLQEMVLRPITPNVEGSKNGVNENRMDKRDDFHGKSVASASMCRRSRRVGCPGRGSPGVKNVRLRIGRWRLRVAAAFLTFFYLILWGRSST